MATTTAVPGQLFKVTRGLGGLVENTKVNVGKLYLHQIMTEPGTNQSTVISATGLGTTLVNNWAIYDGPSSEANLVAKGQGMHTYAGNWYNWFTLVFEVKRFKGSTLQVMGESVGEENEWAIVGGTGDFAMARGIIKRREYHVVVGTEITQELTMEFFCRMLKVPAPTKIGPWGGRTGGTLREMEGKSQRLQSVTINCGGILHAIQFSYIDEDGQVRTAGFWGEILYNKVDNHMMETIKFGPSEFVKQISGVVRDQDYVAKFTIVTNYTTYGPYGFFDGNTSSFSANVEEDQIVVGFFANTDRFIRSIGLYTI